MAADEEINLRGAVERPGKGAEKPLGLTFPGQAPGLDYFVAEQKTRRGFSRADRGRRGILTGCQWVCGEMDSVTGVAFKRE